VSVEARANKMAALAVEDVATWPVGAVIDLWPLVCRLMHTLAIGLMFGNDKEHGYQIAQMISDLITLKWSPGVRACPISLPITPYGRMVRESERLERCILEWADTKRGSLDGGDLLSIVVNNVEEDGNAIRDDTIVGLMPQLFGAVFETCQDLLIWTLVLLAQHPSTARGLLEELQDRFVVSPPSLQGIVGLPRLDAIIKESLRILPPVPMQVRVAQQDTSLAGHPFPMGSRVMLSAFLTNRLPDHYPEPDSFRPERWASINPSPFEYLVFSAGPRSCPGFYLGLAMVKMAVATILLRFRIELTLHHQIDYIARPALKPRGKIRAVLHPQDGGFAATPVSGNLLSLVRSLQ
jgi:cytochrome P450